MPRFKSMIGFDGDSKISIASFMTGDYFLEESSLTGEEGASKSCLTGDEFLAELHLE